VQHVVAGARQLVRHGLDRDDTMLACLLALVSTQLAGIQLAFKTATAANREFVRDKADPIMNLSNQLAARAIAEASDEG